MNRALLFVLAACSSSYQSGSLPSWVSDTGSYTPRTTTRTSFVDAYREPAAKIIAAARADRGAYQKLAHLTDRIGHRLSGSPELDRAIAWAAQAMKDDGHDVRTSR